MDNFDTERFIVEIQRRPSIWDSFSQDYLSRDLKKKCWEDVVNLLGEELTVGEKKDLGFVLQKRWKNIRSCYAREVKRQKNLKSGSGGTNRKSEYVYFKQLQFLQRVVAVRDSPEEEDEENLEGNEVSERPNKIMKKKSKQQMAENKTFVHATNSSVEHRRPEPAEIDEDKLFLLSLLTTLKELPRHIKMATKIKILTLLNEASDHSGNTTYDHTSQSDPGVRMAHQRNYYPGYSTQRVSTITSNHSEYSGNASYPSPSDRNSPPGSSSSIYDSYNSMISTSSPSDTNILNECETYIDLFKCTGVKREREDQ